MTAPRPARPLSKAQREALQAAGNGAYLGWVAPKTRRWLEAEGLLMRLANTRPEDLMFTITDKGCARLDGES